MWRTHDIVVCEWRFRTVPFSHSRFATFEYMRNKLMDENGRLSKPHTLLAGLSAGVAEAVLVVCPMETVKVKFIHDQTQPNPKFKGFVHGVREIIRQEGESQMELWNLLPGPSPLLQVHMQQWNEQLRCTYNNTQKWVPVMSPFSFQETNCHWPTLPSPIIRICT